jgi:hypothetical protein
MSPLVAEQFPSLYNIMNGVALGWDSGSIESKSIGSLLLELMS